MQITIIGADVGSSHAVAKFFGSKGFKIALIARNEEKLKFTMPRIKSIEH